MNNSVKASDARVIQELDGAWPEPEWQFLVISKFIAVRSAEYSNRREAVICAMSGPNMATT